MLALVALVEMVMVGVAVVVVVSRVVEQRVQLVSTARTLPFFTRATMGYSC